MEYSYNLLFAPEPKYDESLSGYIGRLTIENKYENYRWICEYGGLIKDYKIVNLTHDKNDLNMLAKLTNVSVERLMDLTFYDQFGDFQYDKYGILVIGRCIQNKITKICPICLKEETYFKKSWKVSIIITCTKHKCLLVKSCPNCKRYISDVSDNIFKCKCGLDFQDIVPVYVPLEEVIFSILLESKLFQKPLPQYNNNSTFAE